MDFSILSNGITRIASGLRGNNCEKLVTRTATEFKLSGSSINVGPLELKLGEFSDRIRKLIESSDVAVSLDDSQFQLCKEISRMKDEDPLKSDCKRIRLQIILGIGQLRLILGSLKEQQSDELKKSLLEWIKYMSKLHKQSIRLLNPGYKAGMGKGSMEIARIMKYQGLTEPQIQDALKIM